MFLGKEHGNTSIKEILKLNPPPFQVRRRFYCVMLTEVSLC